MAFRGLCLTLAPVQLVYSLVSAQYHVLVDKQWGAKKTNKSRGNKERRLEKYMNGESNPGRLLKPSDGRQA